jgi:hypothetical protein
MTLQSTQVVYWTEPCPCCGHPIQRSGEVVVWGAFESPMVWIEAMNCFMPIVSPQWNGRG